MSAIVAILGNGRAGKDTIADYLVKHHGFVRIALADPMKRFCAEVFDFSHDQLHGNDRDKPDLRYPRPAYREGSDPDTEVMVTPYLTPRYALQTLGTEWGRDCFPNVWINYAIRVAKLVLAGHHYDAVRGVSPAPIYGRQPVGGVVFSDLRFLNEVNAMARAGAVLVRVRRHGLPPLEGVAGHQSEAEQKTIPDEAFDVVIDNNGTIEDLHRQVLRQVVTLVRERAL